LDYKKNNLKNVLHGFFIKLALTIAEPSTTLPLIVSYFTQNVLIVGVYTSFLRGGAILFQLVAAFYAQSYSTVMPYLKIVFLVRVLSWFLIGVIIYFLGEKYPTITLLGVGIGLLFFSISAGFGVIYFNEVLAKVFTHKERGKSLANRQFFAALGAILSGMAVGVILNSFPPPKSYAYLFIISSFLMSVGMVAFSTIPEPAKEEVNQKEKNFKEFLKRSLLLLKKDKTLQLQIITVLLSYSFLFALAYVILEAKEKIHLDGWAVGGFLTVEMVGALVGNLIYKQLAPQYKKIMLFSFSLAILAYSLLLLVKSKTVYFLTFFLLGMAIDGFRISSLNLLFLIAPQKERPIYTALQNSITSLGLFFAIPGGVILKLWGYEVLYLFTIAMLILGTLFAIRLPNDLENLH